MSSRGSLSDRGISGGNDASLRPEIPRSPRLPRDDAARSPPCFWSIRFDTAATPVYQFPMPTAPPCAVVIFGASGDLAKRKLIPAVYEMARENLLHDSTYVVGYSRSEMTDEQYRKVAREAVEKHARTKPIDEALWKKIEPRIYYTQADYGSADDQARVGATLGRLDKKFGNKGNRLFYLSTPPETFGDIIERLGERRLAEKGENDDPAVWHRITIEKPFGRDLASAKALNALLLKYFTEDQVFRIDHYLGKETVQNMMVMRFANAMFEPIWNYKYIDHVQITVGETLGVGTRGGYYDRSGALRDMVQNHIFQLLAIVAMEPPVALDATSVRDEKVKVFKAIRRIRPEDADHFAVRGQYGPGEANGERTTGYLNEKDVPKDSKT